MSTLRTDTLQTLDSSFSIDVDQIASQTDVSNALATLALPSGADNIGYGTITVADYLDHELLVYPSGGDDTTALNTALTTGATQGKNVIGVGTFTISGKVTFKGNADFSNATFNVVGTPPIAMECSTGSAANPTDILYNSVIRLPKRTVNTTKPALGWAGQGIGLRTVNLYSCEVHTGNIVGFDIGFLGTSYDTGNVYNDYFIGHLENNRVNFDAVAGNAAAWYNENNHYNGRYSHYSAEGTDVVGTRHIRLQKSTTSLNNNVFYKPSIEANTAEYHIECGGAYNAFNQARWEATTPKIIYTADNTLQGIQNTVNGGYGVQNVVTSYAAVGGGNFNALLGPSISYQNYGVTHARWANQSSNSSPVLRVYPAGVKAELGSASDWTLTMSSNSLQGKLTADAAERYRLDSPTGRLFFGQGTVAATNWIGAFGANLCGVNANLLPVVDNTYTNGSASFRWSTVYAATGTINTSDKRLKEDIQDISEDVFKAWAKVKYHQYKFKDAVERKQDGARLHFGLLAQDVKEAFESEGLDAFSYGLLCYDEWVGQEELLDEEGKVLQEKIEPGSRYGIRYEEALALECAYLRHKINNL